MPPGANHVSPPMVDVHPIRCRRGKLVPFDRGEGPRDDRPCARVRGRFAGEVTGVEFGEGGVDVVEVEIDLAHHQPVGVDLGDLQRSTQNASGPRVMS